MKYVIMCGGNYNDKFKVPKQLLQVNGEKLVERAIRLLKQNGVNDIAITTNIDAFDYLDVEIIKTRIDYKHDNPERHRNSNKSWLNAYYPFDEPCCYLHGDVYFSEDAIKTIVKTPVENTMFFCIRDLGDGRPAGVNPKGREPLAYKVQNQEVFRKAINELFKEIDNGVFKQDPISWNLYRKINKLPIDYNGYGNGIFNTKGDYIAIDDYTTDVDSIDDIQKIERFLKIIEGGVKMIKVEVIENFSLGRFNEITNIVRKNQGGNGKLYVGDRFECSEELCNYLNGGNHLGRSFIKILEVIPEKTIEKTIEKTVEKVEKPVKKITTRRRKSIID